MELKSLKYWKNQSPPLPNIPFTDPLFPPTINSLISKKLNGEYIDIKEGPIRSKKIDTINTIWKRCSDIFKNQKYLLFENKIEMEDIKQGTLGDCYFLASTAALTEYPNLIYQMFKTKEINSEGYFEIILFIDGKFQIVIIDDYLPIDIRTGKEIYARGNNNELWVCLLEKAWAKINGGYSNIIKGWMHQVLETFTGFPSQSFNHRKTNSEILWDAITYANNNNCILSCSSKKNVEFKGLINSHAYTLIGAYEIHSQDKKVKLVKLRNTWGFGEWNGDWGKKSPLWTNEEIKQVDFNNNNDGTFYMSFDDYCKFFIVTDICFIQHNSYSKSFKIKGEDIFKGQVFNIYIEEKAFFSVSVIRKMWRFNRELNGTIIPSVLILMKYNPNESSNQMMSDFQGVNNSYEDVTLSRNLDPGYYVIYTYHDLFHSTLKEEEYYYVKFDCKAQFKVLKRKMDDNLEGFPFLKQMVIQGVVSSRKFNPEERFQSFISSYRKSGIGHRIIYNHTKKIMKYIQYTKDMKNQFVLSPFNKNNTFTWFIHPGQINCILTMEIDSKQNSTICQKSKGFYVNKYFPKEDNINIFKYINENVSRENILDINSYYDYVTMPLEKAKEILYFEQIDMNENTFNQIALAEQSLINKILKLNPVENERNLSWICVEGENGKYVGQINKNGIKEGRGAFIFQDTVYIGYFVDNKENGQGIIYDISLEHMKYKGNFVDGVKNGKGIFYYKNGDKYEGDFENNKKEGFGIFYFKSGNTWEGPFHDDKMDGEGIFKGKKERRITYIKGILQK